MGTCLWYYIIPAGITLFIIWAIILAGYQDRDVKNNKIVGNEEWKSWPSNLKLPEYFAHNILPYFLWTLCLFMFTYGAYNIDCEIDTSVGTFYKELFILVNIMTIFGFVYFFLLYNVISAIIVNVIALVTLAGMIFIVSGNSVEAAWFLYPYVLWTSYFIYVMYYIYKHNQTHPQMRMDLI